jgi:glutaminase
MYMDNFWRDFGEGLGNLNYLDDVILEHLHYLAGKAVNDLQYQEVNASHVYENDRIAYGLYQSGQFDKDIHKVLS